MALTTFGHGPTKQEVERAIDLESAVIRRLEELQDPPKSVAVRIYAETHLHSTARYDALWMLWHELNDKEAFCGS